MTEVAYRLPGKGTWTRKTMKTEKVVAFIEKLVAKHGDDVEFQYRDEVSL